MREERGQLRSDIIVHEPFTLWGSIAGNVRVIQGGKLYVRGAIYGNLTVEYGGRVHVYGNVSGKLIVHDGAKVIHSGIIGGDVLNTDGRLYIEGVATVAGRVKTKGTGTTVIEPKATVKTRAK